MPVQDGEAWGKYRYRDIGVLSADVKNLALRNNVMKPGFVALCISSKKSVLRQVRERGEHAKVDHVGLEVREQRCENPGSDTHVRRRKNPWLDFRGRERV